MSVGGNLANVTKMFPGKDMPESTVFDTAEEIIAFLKAGNLDPAARFVTIGARSEMWIIARYVGQSPDDTGWYFPRIVGSVESLASNFGLCGVTFGRRSLEYLILREWACRNGLVVVRRRSYGGSKRYGYVRFGPTFLIRPGWRLWLKIKLGKLQTMLG